LQDARGVKRAERQSHRRRPGRAIRADLEGDDTCPALGVTVRSSSPVLALCRQLADAGHDPTTPLEAYRGNTLALRVKSIGQTAQLEVNADGTGFWQRAKARAAPPMRPNLEALSPAIANPGARWSQRGACKAP
jgi:hypothetical protein